MKGLLYYLRFEVLIAVSPRRVLGLLDPAGEGTAIH
jgi:hypothetical protein